jgi:hypothetical protein
MKNNGTSGYVIDSRNISGWYKGSGRLSLESLKKTAEALNRLDMKGYFVLRGGDLKGLERRGTLQDFRKFIEDQGSVIVETASCDDETVISIARQLDAHILSNDFYRDHVDGISDPGEKKELSQYLATHRNGFVWADGNLIVISPEIGGC